MYIAERNAIFATTSSSWQKEKFTKQSKLIEPFESNRINSRSGSTVLNIHYIYVSPIKINISSFTFSIYNIIYIVYVICTPKPLYSRAQVTDLNAGNSWLTWCDFSFFPVRSLDFIPPKIFISWANFISMALGTSNYMERFLGSGVFDPRSHHKQARHNTTSLQWRLIYRTQFICK